MLYHNTPKISVVLPVYNGAEFLAQSIQSVLQQTYENWELIIVDDGSKDNSVDIAKKFAAFDSRIHVYSDGINRKLPGALNKGFSLATGDYLTWTSDDNAFYASAFAKMSDVLQKNKDISFVYANFITYKEQTQSFTVNQSFGNISDKILLENCIGACFLYRYNLARQTGGYDTNLFLIEDYEYWLRLYSLAPNGFFHLNETLYFYRLHERSLTTRHQTLIRQKTADIKLHYLYLLNHTTSDIAIRVYDYIAHYHASFKTRLWARTQLLRYPLPIVKYLIKKYLFKQEEHCKNTKNVI